ncbi:MAG: SidJ-related pseudokinase [Desulfobulbaceae bacterium]|nr:SidJ-related pseudokinase [Desulfobulbaceae bacterium]
MEERLVRERRRLEETLCSPWFDFIAKFMATRNLHELMREYPALATEQCVAVLADLFVDPRLVAERQGLFLFREAAGALLAVYRGEGSARSEAAMQVLYGQLRHGSGAGQRAVCEILAGLPLTFSPPSLPPHSTDEVPPLLAWRDLPDAELVDGRGGMAFVGRSLVAPLAGGVGLLVVKFARGDDSVPALADEARWLAWLRGNLGDFAGTFAVPRPLATPSGGFLFRLGDLPVPRPSHLSLHPRGYAIAFVAPPDYYCYLNEPGGAADLTDGELPALLAKNAMILGRLAGQGIMHDALIPLFHNRVQRDRRADGGYYDWTLGGRLDRWLESCRHPNLGVGGPRDFEHLLLAVAPRRDFYQQMGAQFLSMLLVAASYFRNKEPELQGVLPDGAPVDARHLFDRVVLGLAIEGMYRAYHLGFTGLAAPEALPFDLDRLVQRMIAEMGVDHHMDEILRVADQSVMSDADFIEFLCRRGYPESKAVSCERGREDIVLRTGPHLGGFNQAISLPEMVEAVGAMAAMCVVGRYRAEHRADGDAQADASASADAVC